MARSFTTVCKLLVVFFFVAEAAALETAPGEFIVRYKQGRNTISSLSKTSLNQNVRLRKSWNNINTHFFKAASRSHKVSQQEDDAAMLKELREDPNVLFAEPNYLVRAQNLSFLPTDAPVRAPEALSQGTPLGGTDLVTIAIIDSGLDTNHEVFQNTGRLWSNVAEINGTPGVDDDRNGYIDDLHGWNFLNNNNNLSDGSGHGTHVSGIALASTEDIEAVSPSNPGNQRVQIMPLKFLDADGVGKTSDAINAIYYAVNNGAKVLSNSWGGQGYSGALHEAVAFSFFENRIFIAAAGNSGSNNDQSPIFPANLDVPNVISVGASDETDSPAFFSNFGTETVDISAPGVNILSLAVGGGFVHSSGTSMSTPFVSGAAALMVREAPHFSGYQLRRDLLASADVISGLSNANAGSSRVNFESAVLQAIANSGEANFNPDFTPDFTFSSRDLASSDGGGGTGCGRVKSTYENHNKNMKNSSFKLSHLILMFCFAAPFALIGFVRSRLSFKRKHERYKVDFKGALFTQDGSKIDVRVCTFSLGGAGVKLFLKKDAFEGQENLTLKFTTKSGETKEYPCKAVSSYRNQLGLCFDQN